MIVCDQWSSTDEDEFYRSFCFIPTNRNFFHNIVQVTISKQLFRFNHKSISMNNKLSLD